MDPAAARALADSEELELVTTGRTSGRPHRVRLRFAYADGMLWLRGGERPPAADASGVRRRGSPDRESDWFRNLERDPRCRVGVDGVELEARYEPSTDPDADLKRVVALLREKYGAEWVQDWFVEGGRIPVKLRPAGRAGFSGGRE